MSEWNGATRAQLQGKYYWGAKPVAYYANGSTHFEHQDWLGTERMRTTYNGGVEGSYQSLPFGDGQATSGADTDANHYAQLDLDAESGTAHAQQRQDSNAQGRWLSPDPYHGSYQTRNPQSFNRYVYAGNNPLAAADPSGLLACLGVPRMGGGRGSGVRAMSVGCYYDGGEGGGSGGTGDEEFAYVNDPSNSTDTSNTTETNNIMLTIDGGDISMTLVMDGDVLMFIDPTTIQTLQNAYDQQELINDLILLEELTAAPIPVTGASTLNCISTYATAGGIATLPVGGLEGWLGGLLAGDIMCPWK